MVFFTKESFKVGNAEDLPLKDNSKDIIYNVESSHCYGNVEAFVKEVYRSLKAGGNFCWTDFRDKESMEKLHEIFLKTGFEIVSKKEITKEVLDALDDINDSKVKGISESVPMGMKKALKHLLESKELLFMRRLKLETYIITGIL